ncbi:SDR family NAD(P)-dependent oxidoreductase [Pseudooceanicola sp. 502str34]
MTRALAILGGCGGIGRQLVHDAQAAGYTPIVLDLPRSIEAHPLEGVTCIAVDATSEDSLAAAAAQLPKLAGVVNLCGYVTEALPVMDHAASDWAAAMEGNLHSAFLAAKALVPHIAPGGALVMTGSGLGHFARPGYGPYALSKAGVAMLTRQLALELAPEVRVNCVAPSAVETAFLTGGTGRSDEDAPSRFDTTAYGANIPMGRIAQPADITQPILFLLSDAAGYITGQILHINGGAYMP